MNDVENGAMNSTWKSCVDSFLATCDEKGIEPILCTIPSTSTMSNAYKNAYVRSSGRRYVDIDKAVGADVSVNWYSGLQSGDHVHPSPTGAKVIAVRMIADVPEIGEVI